MNTLGVQQEYIVQQERKKFVDNRGIALECKCSDTEALGQKDQTSSGGWMPLWHLPIPKRNGGIGPHPIGLFCTLCTLAILTLQKGLNKLM